MQLILFKSAFSGRKLVLSHDLSSSLHPPIPLPDLVDSAITHWPRTECRKLRKPQKRKASSSYSLECPNSNPKNFDHKTINTKFIPVSMEYKRVYLNIYCRKKKERKRNTKMPTVNSTTGKWCNLGETLQKQSSLLLLIS